MPKISREMRLLLARLIGLGLLVGVWTGNNKLLARFTQLPVDVAPPPSAPADAQKTKTLANLYPLVAAAEGAPQNASVAPGRLDAAFMTLAEKKTKKAAGKKVPLPDYFLLLPQVLTVDAIANDGAILAGHFYALHEPIRAYAFPTKSGFETPAISAVTASTVTLAAGARHLTLRLRD